MGDVVEEIRCDGSFVLLEADSVVLGVGSSRIFVERSGGLIQSSRVPLRRFVIIHVVNLQLRAKRCKTMTAEADSIKSLNKVEKHGSSWSSFY